MDQLAEVIGGVTKGRDLSSRSTVELPYLRVANVQRGFLDLEVLKTIEIPADEVERYLLHAGDVVLTEGGDADKLGRAALWQGQIQPCIHQNHIFRARLIDHQMPSQWLVYYANSEQGRAYFAEAAKQTVNLASINLNQLRNCPVPLAPLSEQQRIVAAIEQQFTRLDAGVAALKSAQARLKRYRAAILKAAVGGKLTEAWRAEHPDAESASVLVQRILAERRARWEAVLQVKGKDPTKVRSEEPAGPDTTDLPELPEGWCWATLDDFLLGIQAGKSFKCEERPPKPDEIGVIKVSAVTWGEYDELESKTCTEPARYDPNLFVQVGDFLFSRANTIELVGASVIAKNVSLRVMLSDKILRLRFFAIPQEWVLLVLRSRLGRDEIESLATGNQESMRNIAQENIRRIRVPLPPLAEQEQIVAEVERRLSVVSELEATVEANLKRSERLR